MTMSDLRVRDLMTDHVVSIRPGDSVERIYDTMGERSIRHLVVVDDEGDLVGVVSHRDLLRRTVVEHGALPLSMERDQLRKMRVEEVMTSEVETTEPDQPLNDAAQRMFDNKIGCLPVVEGYKVVGMLTESDFVRHFIRSEGARRA
jgi:CBS-domain-containing membrane protein